MSCSDCRTKVCSGCKSRAHPRQSCDEREYSEVQALAKANGWKTCPKCKMIVERSSGYAHMTCRCRQGFCYRCGVKWGRCILLDYEFPISLFVILLLVYLVQLVTMTLILTIRASTSLARDGSYSLGRFSSSTSVRLSRQLS
ncbi:hypothetical protein JVT61DRAFT_8938 [Boletus reticuloceps]|uniref:RBR-type E3 ubiquitin transferase n=1 Tax=Boletus reticuloceps TaxID=495285 RepID=A0A8I2YH10_9AGAM|nr:hypothetical protein JVT61DRAFT_8938 [Boletus reticuloceps]